MNGLPVRVSTVRQEAEGIRLLRLRADGDALLPAFKAGAHIRVHGQAMDGRAATRAYSLVGDSSRRDHYEIGVLREDRGGMSDWMHGLREGDALAIEPPRNDFPLAPHAAEHVLIAGGIGLTPLLAMATELSRQGARFRLWALARTRARLPFADRLAALPPAAVQIHVSNEHGRLDLAQAFAGLDADGHVYVCGPRALIESVLDAARAAGLAPAHVHAERFGAGAAAATDRAFDVELRASRMQLRIEPGQTILEQALAAGLFPSYDCQRGECGACLTRVLDGNPDHRDTVQTAEEKASNSFMTICCSRALSERIVLDL